MAAMTRIKWYPPLDSVKGPESEIEIGGPTTVGDLLCRLCAEDPALSRFVHLDPGSNLVLGLMVLKGETLLRPSDTVEPGGRLEILAAIDGG
ncbi:MAG: MoaD/ThiS family protein [Rhodospirillales bacterium]|jgi:hypothetical protein|nr:MoaD/ThiS family protein [Rhodospirillales bacterium]